MIDPGARLAIIRAALEAGDFEQAKRLVSHVGFEAFEEGRKAQDALYQRGQIQLTLNALGVVNPYA